MRLNGIIIAIDGPTAAGKSTTAREVARQLGYRHLNTGAMYRALALYCLQWGVKDSSDKQIPELLERVYIDVDESAEVMLEGENVAKLLSAPEVAQLASALSTRSDVRAKLVGMQQEICRDGGFVLDGRDIATVVFPDAELKIFLVADEKIRAERRLKELAKQEIEIELQTLEQEIIERDKRDTERTNSPLKKADGAIEIDTSGLTIDDQVERIVELAQKRI